MTEQSLEKIHIRDLLIRCILGIREEERKKKRDVSINITLHADCKKACRSDRIEDTVDYKAIKNNVIAMAEKSSFFLVERFAEAVAEVCLENPGVKRVEVTVEKPGALRFARSVGVEIVRER